MNMVERVARAIAEADRGCDLWEEIGEEGDGRGYLGKDDFRKFARAAIAAMREPPNGTEGPIPASKEYARAIWRQMIDEAQR